MTRLFSEYRIRLTLLFSFFVVVSFSHGQCVLEVDSFRAPTCGLDNGYLKLNLSNIDTSKLLWWKNGSTSIGGGVAEMSNLSEGTYLVNVGSDGCGDGAISTSQTINRQNSVLPVGSLESSTGVSCEGLADGIILVTTTGGEGDLSYTWSHGGTERTASNLAAGTYSVTIEDALQCRDTIDNITVADAQIITIDSLNDIEMFIGGEVQLNPEILGGNGNLSYDWLPKEGLSCEGSCANPRVKLGETTDLTLTVTDDNNCTKSQEITVTVLTDIPEIFVPSGFTPNGDGNNDFFQVYGQGIKAMTLAIFDRWGNKVAQLNSQSETWDGNTAEGKKAPTGTYVYILEYEYLPEMRISLPAPVSGNVTLLRE